LIEAHAEIPVNKIISAPTVCNLIVSHLFVDLKLKTQLMLNWTLSKFIKLNLLKCPKALITLEPTRVSDKTDMIGENEMDLILDISLDIVM